MVIFRIYSGTGIYFPIGTLRYFRISYTDTNSITIWYCIMTSFDVQGHLLKPKEKNFLCYASVQPFFALYFDGIHTHLEIRSTLLNLADHVPRELLKTLLKAYMAEGVNLRFFWAWLSLTSLGTSSCWGS